MIRGVRVDHRSWRQFESLTADAIRRSAGEERRGLREFQTYLRGVMSMQDVTSNWTYVVSVGGKPPGWDISFRDVILRYGRYFHAFGRGGGWPKEPPNYIGFRWGGELRQIHHIDDYEIVDDLHPRFPEIPPTSGTDIIYTLGPPIRPDHSVKNGASYRSAHLWVALDLLLTCDTIKEAHEQTKRRARAAAEPA
jgi:hypothetical protein